MWNTTLWENFNSIYQQFFGSNELVRRLVYIITRIWSCFVSLEMKRKFGKVTKILMKFNDVTLYFSFWICVVSRICKTAAISAIWPQIFLGKNRERKFFFKLKKKVVLLATGRTPKFGPRRKPKTLYMTS